MNKLVTLFNSLAKYNLKYTQFDALTVKRLSEADTNSILDLVKNLDDFGIKNVRIVETLQNHENWVALNRENLSQTIEFFRDLQFPIGISDYIIARNPDVLNINQTKISTNLKDLKVFFSKNEINKIIIKSPKLLTNDLNPFVYKFSYLYVLMGIKQDQMCGSYVFNYDIDHIRQRHLFLSRSGFYDTPNKHGETKVENPNVTDIFDTKLETFLKNSARNLFKQEDYETFCSYLKEENFTDELLGFSIGRGLRDSIIEAMRQSKYSSKKGKEDM